MMSRIVNPAKVLLIDDEPAARLLAQIAFAESRLPAILTCAESYKEGLVALSAAATAPGAAPDLVLLDLNLCDGSGHALLAFIREQPALADIPVVIMSSSSHWSDLAQAEHLGATRYVVKPADFDELVREIDSLDGLLAGE